MSSVYLVKEKLDNMTEVIRAIFSTRKDADRYRQTSMAQLGTHHWVERWAVDAQR